MMIHYDIMENLNKKLHTAAKDGDIPALKVCLQKGADIDYQDGSGETALMMTSIRGDLEVTRLLISRRCKIDITNNTGWTALMMASRAGELEVTRLLLDSGCKKESTSGFGYTALMLAAEVGHLEVTQLLLDRGCIKENAHIDGRRALMIAAQQGHLGVTQLLLQRGCQKEITNIIGQTALHMAAEYGHLQVTRYLVEEGISPFVTSYEGKTPYDFAAANLKKEPRCKEVMEYLQYIMAKYAQDVSSKTSENIQEIPIDEEKVPTEIKLIADKRSIPLYLKLLESGCEKKRDIRLVIVGKKGSGKTSLIRRLFGEDITDVTCTNGIEIHKIKCIAMSDDGIWKKIDENNEEIERHARLMKQYKGTTEASLEEENQNAVQDNTIKTIVYKRLEESMESDTSIQQTKLMKPLVKTKSEVEPPRNQSWEQAELDIKTMFESSVDLLDKEEYATLFLWDFAGDEEFYHTHQTFLSPDAIYLVVTKLNEAGDKKAQDLFRLWMDSIHCYSRLEEDGHKSDDKNRTSDHLDPPVVIVGTWKDAVASESEEIENVCRENILIYTESMAEDERGHIRDEVFISNTEDDSVVFRKIRQYILKLARTMRTWNIDYPLKFIQLEKSLQEKKKELPIIAFPDLKKISTELPNPLNDEELNLYLKFHHEIRALVYFEDLPDYIILDTQWLSNAFKCIVTAKKFQRVTIKNQRRWEEFYNKGILHSLVLEDIFVKEQTIVYNHKSHILNVMEKFDIIIRPFKSNICPVGNETCYYVPCMIKEEPKSDIYEMFNASEDTCKKSTWLCFKFRFLPPHLMNHLIASLCRKYDIAEVHLKKQDTRESITKEVKQLSSVNKKKKKGIALFKATAVFELEETNKIRKLLIMTQPNIIQIQILEFGANALIRSGMYKHIADYVTSEIKKIINTRFRMTNVIFEKKWECGLTQPEYVTGSNKFSEMMTTEYYCTTCTVTHMFNGEWSDQQIKDQCLSQRSEEASDSNPETETRSTKQMVTTKVQISLKGGMTTVSNVSEESTKEGSFIGFTKEEINFAKMGIVTLNILADILFDLLKQDKLNLRPRNNCDITYLYNELRKINKHIPSNGWGGLWHRIQITDIAVGDDIERIRLTRNELQHSNTFLLNDIRFNELTNIIVDLARRFDQHNKPTRLYDVQLNEVLAKHVSDDEVKVLQYKIKNELEMAIEVEIEHKLDVLPQ